MAMKMLVAILSLVVLINSASANSNILFILDGSGSMWGQVEDQYKIAIAKKVMTSLVQELPSNTHMGLQVYGHRSKQDCNDIEMLVPVGSNNRGLLIQQIEALIPRGKTPITQALQQAAEPLRNLEDETIIILLSDGKENCAGDPCTLVRELRAQGVKIKIHVVGFDVTHDESEQLVCIADAGGGKYFSADNADQLSKALTAVKTEVVAVTNSETIAASPSDNIAAEPAIILFADHFERNELGDAWEVIHYDPNRVGLSEGKLLIISGSGGLTEQPRNIVLMQQPVAGDFIATVKLSMQVAENNAAGLAYYIDHKTWLKLFVLSDWMTGSAQTAGRHIGFGKLLAGEYDDIFALQFYDNPQWFYPGSIGERSLKGYTMEPEDWYFQLERQGVKYIARISIDGHKWYDVGSHTMLNKNGRLGVMATAGEGIESPAEFDNFVVKRK